MLLLSLPAGKMLQNAVVTAAVDVATVAVVLQFCWDNVHGNACCFDGGTLLNVHG